MGVTVALPPAGLVGVRVGVLVVATVAVLTGAVTVRVGVVAGGGVLVAVPQAATLQLIRWPVLTGGVIPVELQAYCVYVVVLCCTPTEVILPVCVVALISPYV